LCFYEVKTTHHSLGEGGSFSPQRPYIYLSKNLNKKLTKIAPKTEAKALFLPMFA